LTIHEFKPFGAMTCCMICFKLKSDPIHDLTPHVTCIATSDTKDLTSRITPDLDILAQPDLASLSIFQPIDPSLPGDPGPVEGENDLICQPVSSDAIVSTGCLGHTCPDCKRDWFHDYACEKSPKHTGLCIACAQQTAVIVNRPVEIEQIAMTASQNLSGQERCGIISEHTSVVYLMIHDANNQLKDNWQELLHEHIRNMEVIMEKFKVKCLNTRKILTDETAKELTKLSPDERAQYVRDANKVQRQLKSEAANPEKKEKAEAKEQAGSQKAYKKMMASLLADTRTRRPQATDDELQKIVDKKMKLYQDALESED